jgi:hypothetical protein
MLIPFSTASISLNKPLAKVFSPANLYFERLHQKYQKREKLTVYMKGNFSLLGNFRKNQMHFQLQQNSITRMW